MSKTVKKSRPMKNLPGDSESSKVDSLNKRETKGQESEKKNRSSTSLLQKFLCEVSEVDNEDLEYKENEELNNIGVLLRSRKDILCYKFIENIRKRLEKKKGTTEHSANKRRYLTEMITVSDQLLRVKKTKSVAKADVIDDLDKYIESLNLDEDDLNDIGIASSSTMDIALGTHWKETVTDHISKAKIPRF